jgi:hypothetical protein
MAGIHHVSILIESACLSSPMTTLTVRFGLDIFLECLIQQLVIYILILHTHEQGVHFQSFILNSIS